ncbi:MAG TPA: 5'/3'-nucleotidase SurE [Microthrixaceae bacterium]|jgi:5'-nucleotidase|nr:5'/3'-nucleotidase SurE [Microthrixaceae bacterium]
MRQRRWIVTGVALMALVATAAGCGSDDESKADAKDQATSTASSTTAAGGSSTTAAGSVNTRPPPEESDPSKEALRILVSNDDGIGAKGIDALVMALRMLPNTEVTVVAPKDNQSGTGSKTTEGEVAVAEATTISGYNGTAVSGYPSDAVIYALDKGGMPTRPHVVITGINEGANIGPLVNISGTVGAARAAAQRGIPALASSQGLATEPDYPSGVKYVLEWLAEHRAALLDGTAPVTVTSLNIPTCASGSIRGVVEVPTAADAGGRELFTSNCESTTPAPTDDVDGFSNGYATFSTVPNAA